MHASFEEIFTILCKNILIKLGLEDGPDVDELINLLINKKSTFKIYNILKENPVIGDFLKNIDNSRITNTAIDITGTVNFHSLQASIRNRIIFQLQQLKEHFEGMEKDLEAKEVSFFKSSYSHLEGKTLNGVSFTHCKDITKTDVYNTKYDLGETQEDIEQIKTVGIIIAEKGGSKLWIHHHNDPTGRNNGFNHIVAGFPRGKTEKHESPVQAAIRKGWEETCIIGKPTGAFIDKPTKIGNKKQRYYIAERISGIPSDWDLKSKETSAVKLIDIMLLKKYFTFLNENEVVSKTNLELLFFYSDLNGMILPEIAAEARPLSFEEIPKALAMKELKQERQFLVDYANYIESFLKNETETFKDAANLDKALREGRGIMRTFAFNTEENMNISTEIGGASGIKGISPYLKRENFRSRSKKERANVLPLCFRYMSKSFVPFNYEGRLALITIIPNQRDLIIIHQIFNYYKDIKNKDEIRNIPEFSRFAGLLQELKETVTRPDMFCQYDIYTNLDIDNRGRRKIIPQRNDERNFFKTTQECFEYRKVLRDNAINYTAYSNQFDYINSASGRTPIEQNEMTADLRGGVYPIIICTMKDRKSAERNYSEIRIKRNLYIDYIANHFPDLNFYTGTIHLENFGDKHLKGFKKVMSIFKSPVMQCSTISIDKEPVKAISNSFEIPLPSGPIFMDERKAKRIELRIPFLTPEEASIVAAELCKRGAAAHVKENMLFMTGGPKPYIGIEEEDDQLLFRCHSEENFTNITAFMDILLSKMLLTPLYKSIEWSHIQHAARHEFAIHDCDIKKASEEKQKMIEESFTKSISPSPISTISVEEKGIIKYFTLQCAKAEEAKIIMRHFTLSGINCIISENSESSIIIISSARSFEEKNFIYLIFRSLYPNQTAFLHYSNPLIIPDSMLETIKDSTVQKDETLKHNSLLDLENTAISCGANLDIQLSNLNGETRANSSLIAWATAKTSPAKESKESPNLEPSLDKVL